MPFPVIFRHSCVGLLGVINLGLLLPNVALAQDILDVIIISAHRVPFATRRIATSVAVLQAEQITLQGNPDLLTLLRQLPGISASNSGGAGSTSALRVRGEEAFRTLVMLDGIRLNDPAGTQISSMPEQLLSNGVEKVEVLRGPQGLGYGADAGGVVNIYSPTHTNKVKILVETQGGAAGLQQNSSSINAGNNTADFYIQASQFTTEGINHRVSDSVLRDQDGYENTTLHARGSWQPTPQVQLQLVQHEIKGLSDFDGCYDVLTFATVHTCSAAYDLTASKLDLTYTSSNSSHTLNFARSTTQRESRADGKVAFAAEGELERWEYHAKSTAVTGMVLLAGLDHETALNNAVGRQNRGAWIEYLSDFSSRFYLSAGLRYDDNDDFGRHQSGRVSAAYLIQSKPTVTRKYHVSIGSGFRAPSPYEIGYNRSMYAYPPATQSYLHAETSQGYEAGIDFYTSRLVTGITWFDQKIDNAIEFDLANYSGYLQQQGLSTSRGVELQAAYALGSNFSLQSNYTWNDSNNTHGMQRLRRPQHLLNAGLRFTSTTKNIQSGLFLRAVAKAVDETPTGRIPLENFAVLDWSARYGFENGVEIFGRVENLLNADYQEITDYNSMGRGLYAGLRYQF